jgi:hypothetical protein
VIAVSTQFGAKCGESVLLFITGGLINQVTEYAAVADARS